MKTILIIMALAGLAFAQTAPPATKPPIPAEALATRLARITPITPEQRARFWRAQAEWISASMQAQKAKSAMDSIQAELAKACGDQQLVAGPDGEPTCSPKATPEKPTAQ
jgi:hypothetical protein